MEETEKVCDHCEACKDACTMHEGVETPATDAPETTTEAAA